MGYDVHAVRARFPALAAGIAHFDGPGGSQVPDTVAAAVADTLLSPLANRGSVTAAERAADAIVLAARAAMGDLLGADPRGVVFGRSMTALTFDLARTLAATWRPGDEVIVTRLDHDANIRPWVDAATHVGATVRWAEPDKESGELPVEAVTAQLSDRTRLVAVTGASNLIGTRPDVAAISRAEHDAGALVHVDGVHLTPHAAVDVAALGADFYAWTAHKAYGPTGIGVLHGRREILEAMPPFLGGGHMISRVERFESRWAEPPMKFEAGTSPIAEAVGLGAAVDYLRHIGLDAIHRHEQAITAYALEGLQSVPGLTVLGPLDAAQRGGAISFELAGVHPHDIAQVLDSRGIAIRAGHHCAKPAHARFGVQSSSRMSSYLYTTPAEIDAFVEGLEYTRSYFKLGTSV